MGLFSKETLSGSGIFHGFTDYHTHILPGVDDGIKTMEDSIAVLKYYEKLGVSSVWCTPHIMEDIPNPTSRLKERFSELVAEYKGPISLHLSSENMMDSLFLERLEEKDVLPFVESEDHLLVETSYFGAPSNMDDILYKVMSAGYFPVLAHPERYNYMENKEYDRLHRMGVKFQLNVMSLMGMYGDASRKKAEYIYKKGMYSFLGTDLHTLVGFEQRINSKINIKL